MEVSPPTSSNASSQPEGSTSDSISGGFSAVTVAVTAGRPTPTPSPSPASAASALSNSAIPTASQPQPSNVAENSTNDLSKGDEAVKNDSSSNLTFSIASTPTPAANYSSSLPMPMHNESVIATPGPATSFEMNLLGREILAASATASAMMDGYGYDGFGSNDGAKAMTHYLRKDDFALPPFLQVHLDETYHASSSSSMLVLPPIPANIEVENKQQGGVLFRLSSNGPNLTPAHKTASTPINVTALGTAPPNPIGRRVAVNNGNVHTSNSMATLARANSIALANTSALYTSTSSIKHRSARSLPLRKRSFREEEDETETMIEARPAEENVVKRSSKTRPKGLSTKKPSVKKATLVRHNYNDSRSTCKCKKSQCLKLYCDCFQSGRMCDPNLCECVSCMNTEEYDGPNGKRTQAIDECMTKNPKAFEKRQKSIDEGCGCKKNKCLKKYCVCFNVGERCDELCRCSNCENREIDEEEIFLNDEVVEKGEVKSETIVQPPPPTEYDKYDSLGERLVSTSPVSDSDTQQESHVRCTLQQQQQDFYQMYSLIQGDYIVGNESQACTSGTFGGCVAEV